MINELRNYHIYLGFYDFICFPFFCLVNILLFNNNAVFEIRIEDVFTRYINLPDQEREQ